MHINMYNVIVLLSTIIVISVNMVESAPKSLINHHQQRLNVPPRGCKWMQVPLDVAGSGSDVDDNNSRLSCKLRTISGVESLLGNMSTYQADQITNLNLECSDVLFFESSLEASKQRSKAGFLGRLKKLKDLTIEYCKIKYIPSTVFTAMRDLRTLSLRTHNSDWSAMNLEIHPESFRGLSELKTLELSDNNIWTLPTGVFCPLYSLKVLNMTKNHLTEVTQLGFADLGNGPTAQGKSCNTGLESLDLSANDISSLPENGLSALRSLTTLFLQDNLLSSMADRSFVGLQSLKVLNMSSNQVIALPPELFQSTRALKQLYLQNNSLSVLAPGLLEGLAWLEVLDMSHNELTSTWVNRDTFAGLIRLVVLKIGYNSLTKIDHSVFKGLYSLQILNLEHNSIDTIAENAFSDLKNLYSLTLSNNRLKRIEVHHLSDLFVLNQLYIESNLIESIDHHAFENLTQLSDLSLNDNLLTEVPSGLGKLSVLKSLDLGKNKIKTVSNESFEGLQQLLGLRLVDNQITNISRDAFITLSSLHVLNLASNQIKHIDQSAFISNPTIRAIRLDSNKLEDISSVFTSLPSLVWLNVSDNQLRWFDYSHFPSSLEWLDMHRNNITELSNYFELKDGVQIKMLDVSHNELSQLEVTSLPNSIEKVLLNDNQIREIEAGTFKEKPNLERVVLSGNKLSKIDVEAFALSQVADDREMPQFFIANNPLHCDCNMEWLQRVNELSHMRYHPRVLDLDQAMCTMEHERDQNVRPLMELKSKDFLCRYESHCFALCHCCDFEACDCKMTCPDRCSCFHDHAWNENIVDCGHAGYTDVPDRIPMDATTIYLDGNDLGELSSHVFIGKKKLERLFLNNSNIHTIDSRAFNGASPLKELHLEDNTLQVLNGLEFDPLRNLKAIHLDRNEISKVGTKTFANLKSLERVTIADNKLDNFLPWTQLAASTASGTLLAVSLEGNKLKCDCKSLNYLQEWVKLLTYDFDLERIICTDGQIVGDAIKRCQDSHQITEQTPIVQQPQIVHDRGYIPVLAAALVVVMGAALIVALICVFRQDVRLWVYSKLGMRLFKNLEGALPHDDNEKMYDAYMIYSRLDEDYTARIVSNELHHLGYSMCLHHRDVPPSLYISESLHSAAEASKKIILLLSMTFLQNEWSKPHFRVALQSVIESIRPDLRKQKLILILTVPVEILTMDPIFHSLIKTCTVICWGERRFWDKLRFALPDICNDKMQRVRINNQIRYTPAPVPGDFWGRTVLEHDLTSTVGSNHDDCDCCTALKPYDPSIDSVYNYQSASSLSHVYATIPEMMSTEQKRLSNIN